MTTPRALRLDPSDNVIIAIDDILAGAEPAGGVARARARAQGPQDGGGRRSQTGAPIRKFGQIIGFASQPIAPGEWVHEHNCAMHEFARDYHFGEDARPRERSCPSRSSRPSRAIGAPTARSGRATISAILTSVNCSATVARLIAQGGRALGHARRLPQCRRRHRARARHGLRHGRQGRGLRRAQAHAMGLRRQSQHGAASSWSGWAAKCSRSAA